jgi:hypothetical protein
VSSSEDEYDDGGKGEGDYMGIPAQRTASEVVAGPPKVKRPVAKTVDYDALGYKERLELQSNEQYVSAPSEHPQKLTTPQRLFVLLTFADHELSAGTESRRWTRMRI